MAKIIDIKKLQESLKKQWLIKSLCREENDITDCGLCDYEFTDTCHYRLIEIEMKCNDEWFKGDFKIITRGKN